MRRGARSAPRDPADDTPPLGLTRHPRPPQPVSVGALERVLQERDPCAGAIALRAYLAQLLRGPALAFGQWPRRIPLCGGEGALPGRVTVLDGLQDVDCAEAVGARTASAMRQNGAPAPLPIGWLAGADPLVLRGALTLDLGIGRCVRPLGPITRTIDAPPDVVFDVIAAPYLDRTPRAMQDKLRVWERGSDMVLAEHFTSTGRLTTATLETVRFERPERISFRLVRGPVPRFRPRRTSSEPTSGGTAFGYTGELGTDLWRVGQWWGNRVAVAWERAAAAHSPRRDSGRSRTPRQPPIALNRPRLDDQTRLTGLRLIAHRHESRFRSGGRICARYRSGPATRGKQASDRASREMSRTRQF